VFLETAHPVKFLDVIEAVLPVKIKILEQIKKSSIIKRQPLKHLVIKT